MKRSLSAEIWLAALIAMFVLGPDARAQLPTATILGVVRDASGAVMPGSRVIARHVETGYTRTMETTSDGSYHFPALPVGNYDVRVEQAGFSPQVRTGLALAVGQEAVINFSMSVGAVEQTIEVTAEAPLVNTTSGTLGGLVNEQRMADLPLNGRSFVDLALLQTGVVEHVNSTRNKGHAGLYYSSNGATVHSNNYLLDGAPMATLLGYGPASVSGTALGMEGMREFRVLTNSFSAEYGITMGSQMVVVSKSGTNDWHGNLFEYFRNSALDARNFFDLKSEATPRRLPAFTRNNFGGSVGGPIQQEKTFFHAVYEGVRERLGKTNLINVIPASAKVDGGTGGVAQIAPIVKPWLALFPDPNLPGNRYTFASTQPTREDFGQVRVDYTVSPNSTIFARHTIQDSDRIQRLDYPQFSNIEISRNQWFNISENHIFSPTLLNTFRFAYARSRVPLDSPSGIIGPQFSMVPGKEIGGISIGGVQGFGPDGALPEQLNLDMFTWSDDLFYTRGRHSWKFGALINHYRQLLEVSTLHRGSISFANLINFLRAQPTTYGAVTPGSFLQRIYQYQTFGFYVQDDVRAASTLTLNLGLRYEFQTTITEVSGHGSYMRDIQRDAQPTVDPQVMRNPSLKNFSPRFGFAWDVRGNGQTAVRGGFGLLYDVGQLASAYVVVPTAMAPFSSRSTVVPSAANPSFTLPFFFPPESLGKTLRPVDYLFQQPHMLQYNLTVERQLPWNMALTLGYGGSRGINLPQSSEGNPTVPAGIPVGRTCVPRPANQPLVLDGPKCWLGNEPRTNRNWDTIDYKTAGASSWYNSLQVVLNKRLSHDIEFQSSYTWSKMLDETQSQLGDENTASSSRGPDPSNRKLDKGLSSFDLAHNWRFNTIYRLPSFVPSAGTADKLLNGWWLSGILTIRSGYPFTPEISSNRSRSKTGGAGRDHPDLAPGRNFDEIILGGPERYFDPTGFMIQPAGFLGNVGRNTLRGPGFVNLDFTVAKDTPLAFLGESGKLEFRAEFFNLLNRANFASPNRTVYAGTADVQAPLATAGQITGTVGTSRQVQLALKILF